MKLNTPIESVRNQVRKLMNNSARLLNKVTFGKVTPNMVTYTSLYAHVVIASMIGLGHSYRAAVLLVFFGLFDTLDGELARLQKKSGNKGMFLDSVTDRAKEIMLYIGAVCYFLRTDNSEAIIWATAALGLSLLVSYLNAWGEVVTRDLKKKQVVNKTFRGGFMTYDIRMFVIFLGLASLQLDVAVTFIAIFAGVTAYQRFTDINRRLST